MNVNDIEKEENIEEFDPLHNIIGYILLIIFVFIIYSIFSYGWSTRECRIEDIQYDYNENTIIVLKTCKAYNHREYFLDGYKDNYYRDEVKITGTDKKDYFSGEASNIIKKRIGDKVKCYFFFGSYAGYQDN
jgi:hypothetical protein